MYTRMDPFMVCGVFSENPNRKTLVVEKKRRKDTSSNMSADEPESSISFELQTKHHAGSRVCFALPEVEHTVFKRLHR